MENKDSKFLEVDRRDPRESEYGNFKSSNHSKVYEGCFGKDSAMECAELSSLEGKRSFSKDVLEGSVADRLMELEEIQAKIRARREAVEIKNREQLEYYRKEAEASAAKDMEFEEAWRRLMSYSIVRNEALDWKLPEHIETDHHANDFIPNSFVASPHVDGVLIEREEMLDHGNAANVLAGHDWMCDDYGTARSVEDHLVADLHVQDVHDDEIYRLNEYLLSARSHSATVEERESECPDGEVFEEWIFSDGEDEDEHDFDIASDVGAGSECSAVHEGKAETTVLATLTWMDEAQEAARQCGSGIANTTQVSRTGMLKYLSKTPGEQATHLLRACEEVIERSSNDGTYGEIAWSHEPC